MPLHRFAMVMIPGNNEQDKQIRDMKVGDMVYTYDYDFGLMIKPIIEMSYTGIRDSYRMRWRSSRGVEGYVDLTGDHLVRMLDGKWQRVTAIRENMRMGEEQFVLAAGHHQLDLLRITGDRAKLGIQVQGYQERGNHQIIGIELAGKRLQTYEIIVEETENFIASEICVHDGTYA